jgi:hypothetical protein
MEVSLEKFEGNHCPMFSEQFLQLLLCGCGSETAGKEPITIKVTDHINTDPL